MSCTKPFTTKKERQKNQRIINTCIICIGLLAVMFTGFAFVSNLNKVEDPPYTVSVQGGFSLC